MRILLTGGAGFIGSHFANLFASPTRPLKIVDNLSTGHISNLADSSIRASTVRADYRDLVPEQLESVEVVIHLAARVSVQESIVDPEGDRALNFEGTIDLARKAFAAGARAFIFASSAAVYGSPERLPLDEGARCSPISPYGANKLEAEGEIRKLAQSSHRGAVSLRFFNVYGPRQVPNSPYSGVISRFIERAVSGNPLVIHGDGVQTRDFIFVEDVAHAVMAAAERAMRGDTGVYNIGSGFGTPIGELARTVIDLSHSSSPLLHGPARPGDIRHSVAAVEMARIGLGWSGSTPLMAGLRKTISWQEGQGFGSGREGPIRGEHF